MAQYEIIRSQRKTISIQIRGGTLLVRAPAALSDAQIRRFVESKAQWIQTHLDAAGTAPSLPAFTDAELGELTRRAKEVIPARAARFASLLGVSYGRVTIRAQRSRWGSCSAKGNLNFNCLLMLVPEPVLDYVIVHELCHRKELNHSPRFWALVAQLVPDHKQRRKWLKDHANALIGRLPR